MLAPLHVLSSLVMVLAAAGAQESWPALRPGTSELSPASAPNAQDTDALRQRLEAVEARLRAFEQAGAPTERDLPAAPLPFAWGDFTWMPGGYAPARSPLQWGCFTGELRVDTAYHYSFADPVDNTLTGSSEVFRHDELQLTHLGIGGEVFYRNVQARFMTQFGMYAQTTPRNDASPARGQWHLDDAYRYLSEAYAGYHIDALHGVNIQAGIFMSYIGLWSYYNFDNWTYQPSFVSSNTPWFFEGLRVQVFTSDRLKIEPWLINGWQSYGKFVDAPGVGGQVRWSPEEWLTVVSNNYVGKDTLGLDRLRVHSDNSVMVRYHDAPTSLLSKAAASLTVDGGFESGAGAHRDNQYFLGFMAYHRLWFGANHWALTAGGGAISNPGRYLVLVPPINGATAASGSPYFSAAPGDTFHAWDTQVALDYMPVEHLTFRLEFNHRHANVPYFAGHGGVTPSGGNTGSPGTPVPGFTPDLVRDENRITFAMMVRL